VIDAEADLGRSRSACDYRAAPRQEKVSKEIGPIAKPRQIMVVEELPKTRSGKIMRRLLRDVAEHREVGDVTTLADSSVMDLISQGLEKGGSAED
jgi:acetyl-CoA synthetase